MDPRIEQGLRQHFEAFAKATDEDGGRLGFKVAFNPPAVQEKLGLPFSLVAGLRERVLHADGPHSLAGGTRIVLEAEVAVELRAGVAANASEGQAAAAIGALMPALEVVDFDRPLDQLTDILREGVFQRAVVFGAPTTPPPDGRVSGVTARVFLNDEPVASVDAEVATGQLPQLLLHIARVIEPYGVRLQAGDRLILGSMVAPILPNPGDRLALELEGIGRVDLEFVA